MKKLILIVFLPIYFFSYSQVYMYADNDKLMSSKDSLIKNYKVVKKEKKHQVERIFNQAGNLISETFYSDYKKKINDGLSKVWFDNGMLKSEINYKKGKLDGKIKTYWPNGKLKRDDTFKEGLFINGICYDSSGLEINHFDFQIMPEYPGGNDQLKKFIFTNVQYPKVAFDNGISGIVHIQFLIYEDGSHHASILKGIDPSLNNEALRIANLMPKWKPGYQDGEPVKVMLAIPIKFNLE
jgi:protein TonB